MSGDVRFIRVRGRIVPIRGGHAKKEMAKGSKPTGLVFKMKPTTAGERFGSGFRRFGKVGLGVGGFFGGAAGALTVASQSLGSRGRALGIAAGAVAGGIAGAAQGGLSWGLVGGGLTAAFGPRHKAQVVGVRFMGRKKKK